MIFRASGPPTLSAALAFCLGCGSSLGGLTGTSAEPGAAAAPISSSVTYATAPAPPPPPLPSGARWRAGDVSLAGAEGLALSPGAHYVARRKGPTAIEILDARTRGLARTLDLSTVAKDFILAPRFSPNDALLAVSYRAADAAEHIAIYEVESRRLLRTLDVEDVEQIAFSPDSAALAYEANPSGTDTSAGNIIDLTSGKSHSLEIPRHSAIAIGPKGARLAAASCQSGDPKELIVFDASGEKKLFTKPLAAEGLCALAFSPDGGRVAGAGSLSGKLRVWSAETGNLVFERAPRTHENRLVAFAPDGSVWSAGERGELLGWDERGAPLSALPPPGGLDPSQLGFNGNEVAALDDHGTLAFWDRTTAKLTRPSRAFVDILRFSDDGLKLYGFLSLKNMLQTFDAATGEALDIRLLAPDDARPWLVPGMPVSKQTAWRGAFAAAAAVHKDLLWNSLWPTEYAFSFVLSDGKTIEQVGATKRPPRAFDFGAITDAVPSPDGKWISARGEQGAFFLYDLKTLKRKRDLAPPGEGHYQLSRWSPKSDAVALWAEGGTTLGLVEVASKGPGGAADLGSHILDVAFSPDGKRVAVGLENGSISILDVASKKETSRLEHPHTTGGSDVRAVAFSLDGKSLASASSEGTVLLWNVEPGRL